MDLMADYIMQRQRLQQALNRMNTDYEPPDGETPTFAFDETE